MDAYLDWQDYCRSALSAGELCSRFAVPLSSLSTFQIGGIAKEVCTPLTFTAFCEAVQILEELHLPYFVLGNGSNVLFSEEGFDGVILSCCGLHRFVWEGETLIAGCGTPLPRLEKEAWRAGLSGLEFSVGIPASLGGAVCRNAGAFSGCMGDLVTETVCYDLSSRKILRMKAEEHGFAYRYSHYQKKERILLCAVLCLTPDLPSAIEQRRTEYLSYRKRTQPKEPSAGSVFLRQGELLPAVLLDRAGCKGMREGDAQISTLHAGFIVNLGKATAGDVLTLIQRCREKVRDCFGISLQCELEVVGRNGVLPL